MLGPFTFTFTFTLESEEYEKFEKVGSLLDHDKHLTELIKLRS